MMPYHNHNNHHSNHHSGSHNSHHSQSLMYQSVQYQTPYNSSYSPAGSNSDFPESNPALYYVKQPYGNYPQHSHHGSINHMGSYTASNSSHNHASNNNQQERSYQNSPSDPSLVPTALQPMMSYTGKITTTHKTPSTRILFSSCLLTLVLTFYDSYQAPIPRVQAVQVPLQLHLKVPTCHLTTTLVEDGNNSNCSSRCEHKATTELTKIMTARIAQPLHLNKHHTTLHFDFSLSPYICNNYCKKFSCPTPSCCVGPSYLV